MHKLYAALILLGWGGCLQKASPRTVAPGTTQDLSMMNTITPNTDGPAPEQPADQSVPSDLMPPNDLAPGPTHPIFVTAGYQTRHAISTNGTTWQHDDFLPPTGGDAIYNAVVIGNGVILLAGDPGMTRSTDGLTFTQQTIPTSFSHEGCGVFAHGKFVFVSNANSLTTTDGLTWQSSTGGANVGHCKTIVNGNGYFLVYGDNGAHKRSVDGLTWTDFSSTGPSWSTVGYVNGGFVGIGNVTSDMANVGHTALSTDGLTWTDDAYILTRYATSLGGIAYGNGIYTTSDQTYEWWSTDAKTWTHTGGGFGGGSVVFFDNQFVGIGSTTVKQSSDGKSFTTVLNDTALDGGAHTYLTALGAGYIN